MRPGGRPRLPSKLCLDPSLSLSRFPLSLSAGFRRDRALRPALLNCPGNIASSHKENACRGGRRPFVRLRALASVGRGSRAADRHIPPFVRPLLRPSRVHPRVVPLTRPVRLSPPPSIPLRPPPPPPCPRPPASPRPTHPPPSAPQIPNAKRLECSLTYVYGIGPTTASQIMRDTGLENERVGEMSEDSLNVVRAEARPRPSRRRVHPRARLWSFVSVLPFFHPSVRPSVCPSVPPLAPRPFPASPPSRPPRATPGRSTST